MPEIDLNRVAERAKLMGYSPVYVSLIRSLRVVQRSPLVFSGPERALEIAGDREDTATSGRHGWWLRREMPFLLGEPCGFQSASEVAA